MTNNKNITVFSVDALVFVYVQEWLKNVLDYSRTPFRPLHFMYS